MKKIVVCVCFLLAFALFESIGQKSQPRVVYTHNFPAAMGDDVKNAYIKLFEKGRILYQVNCAKCHNTKIDGVELMPEFTKEHLAQYELRIQNPEHEEAISEMRVNAEELQNIMIFLTYYKKVEQPKGK